MSEALKVGLALSGGGAKGAYHVGVVKALAASGTEIHAISGASIGALNGAILASSTSLNQGAERLSDIWRQLSEQDPVSFNKSVYLKLLLQFGMVVGRRNVVGAALAVLNTALQQAGKFIPSVNEYLDDALLSDKPLLALMQQYLDMDALASGVPLFVSLYPTEGGVTDILNCALADFGLGKTRDSVFYHLQSLAREEQKEALMASAALPLLFKAREVEGQKYSDGGMGGWSKVQGNTPVAPLVEAGCNLVIVTHLSDGSLWQRHAWPDTTFVEIRPATTLRRQEGAFGGARDLLGFNAGHVNTWIAQGYEDTMACMARIKAPLQARQALTAATGMLQSSQQSDAVSQDALQNAMSRLRR